MSIIQTIRDKGARVAVILIALSLIGFILMDAFTGRSQIFSGSNSTALGKVNGKTIDNKDFSKKLQYQENVYQQQGQAMDEASKQQLMQSMWDQEVNQALLRDEFDKLGMSIGKKEMNDILYVNPPDDLKKQFTDPQSGQFDANKLAQVISETKKRGKPEEKEQLENYLSALEYNRMVDKYKNLIAGTIHFPKWLIEKQNADNSLMAKISFVNIPYNVIPDSAKEVAVSDQEISDYISKHKDRYQQKVETRTIEYVLFSAAPSAADSAVALDQIRSLKQQFASATNVQDFLNANATAPYDSTFRPKSKLPVAIKDSIANLPSGQVYGPYLDNGSYNLARLMEVRQLPDSVYARHILIRTGEGGFPDSVAEQRIDSAIKAIEKGASFVSVMKKVSMDEAANSQDSLGIMRFSSAQIQDKEHFDEDFGKYILFDGVKGQRKKIKTKFGWHYIEIVDQKNFELNYKIAYLTKPIEASDATDQAAENAARSFAAGSEDVKSFDANYEKTLKPKGVQKYFAPDITETSFRITGIGDSRPFVKKVFDTDKGDAFQFDNLVGYNYIVAAVTEVNKEGTMSVAAARRMIEPVLRNKKKAAIIASKIGKVASLDAVANAANEAFHAKDTTRIKVQLLDSVRFSSQENTPLAFETKVLGVTFNPENNGKLFPQLIEGNYGSSYAVHVDAVSATVVENADINNARKVQATQARMNILLSAGQFGGFGQQQYDPAAILRKAASIKDNRSKFY